jgi:Cu(I)/Ag(I) efflux system membrane fusion protein
VNDTAFSSRLRKAAVLVALVILFSLGFWVRGCFAPAAPPHSDTEAPTAVSTAAATIWTCSMHPQIRQPDPGLCPICAMDLIPVTEEAQDEPVGMRRLAVSEAAKALMNIQTAPVERRFVTTEIALVGEIVYDETKLATISAWVPGRIDRLFVDYTGVQVKEGDHLVSLYSPQLLSAQQELRSAAEAVNNISANAPEVLLRTAQSTLESARQKLSRWGLTDEQVRQAETGKNISDHITIYSPMGGTVIERSGTEGMYVETGTPIYRIADLSRVWVFLDAYESDLPWIHFGQEVTFTTEAYPGRVFTGQIAFIDPQVNPATRTVDVRVNVDNEQGLLKPAMFVRAKITAQVAQDGRVMNPELAGKWISPMHPEIVKDGPGTCDICGMDLVPAADLGYVPASVDKSEMPLVIPASAPLITGKRALVYVEVPGTERPTYEGREIVLGPRAGDYYMVHAGLAEGERVVLNGNFKIDSAIQLYARPSMMDPEIGLEMGVAEGGYELALDQKADLLAVLEAFTALEGEGEHPGDPNATQAFIQAVDAVDPAAWPVDAQNLWIELAMKLRADAAILANAQTDPARRDALDTLRRHLDILRNAYNLEPEPARVDAPAHFLHQVTLLVDAYLDVQQALADDNLDAAKTALQGMREAFAAVEAKDLSSAALTAWQTQAEALSQGLEAMAAAEDLPAMRTHFEPVSMAIIELARQFALHSEADLYVVHCPMAFDFEGADWLQVSQDVLNPYFGSEMLTCGTVKDHVAGPAAEGHVHE